MYVECALSCARYKSDSSLPETMVEGEEAPASDDGSKRTIVAEGHSPMREDISIYLKPRSHQTNIASLEAFAREGTRKSRG